MSDDHSAAKMAAGAAAVSAAFFAMGTPSDPNAPRLSNAQDWERCLKHPVRVVPLSPGQSNTSNFIHNCTDGARVAAIWSFPFFVGIFGHGYVMLAMYAVLIIGAVILRCRD